VSLGYATDLGVWDRALEDGLQGLDALVLESNHCPDLLARGPYPAWLQARVAGDHGHLSNGQCRTLVERLLHPGLRHVALAHLSAQNNTPDHALATVTEIFGGPGAPRPLELTVGSRKGALPPVELSARPPARTGGATQTTLPL
jgi:phosphoribosyl 1,2-cyclic phosphodiesterase